MNTIKALLAFCKTEPEIYMVLALAIRAKILTPAEAETEGQKLGITILNY